MINKIQRSIDLALVGKLALERKDDYCLRVTRQLIEDANDWDGGEFFEKIHFWPYRTPDNLRAAPKIPWARSVENALIQQGMVVPLAQARAGDPVFSRVPAKQGHVGMLGIGPDGKLWVLENATVRRGRSLGGALNWVPLSTWGTPTTVGRLPEAWVFEAEPVPAPPIVKPKPAVPMTSTAQRVVVTDGHGTFTDRTGQRVELPLGDGRVLIVNATDPDTVWVDLRGAK